MIWKTIPKSSGVAALGRGMGLFRRPHGGGPLSVEFVCTGNICRSPFAAEVAITSGLPRAQVFSSGVWAEVGRECPPEAVAAAAGLGVDLGSHAARQAERSGLEARAWVLTMEFGQLGRVRRLLPSGWRGHTALLGEFFGGDGIEIPDPYGLSVSDYRRVYQVIQEAVGNWLAVAGVRK